MLNFYNIIYHLRYSWKNPFDTKKGLVVIHFSYFTNCKCFLRSYRQEYFQLISRFYMFLNLDILNEKLHFCVVLNAYVNAPYSCSLFLEVISLVDSWSKLWKKLFLLNFFQLWFFFYPLQPGVAFLYPLKT